MLDSGLVDTTLKTAPPVVVSSGYFLGVSWDNWVLILTAIYTALQIGEWVWNKVKIFKEKRREHS